MTNTYLPINAGSNIIRSLFIGALRFPCPVILAPLAGISDLPYRTLGRRFGAPLAFAEMISARSLVFQSRQAAKMLATSAGDRPLGVQLLGSDPDVLKRAVELLAPLPHDMLDLNAACPVAKVTSRGEGAGMLKSPGAISRALQSLLSVSTVPVTLKMRIGWDSESIGAVAIAQAAEQAGASALFVHGRTREQGYSGTVWYDVMAAIRRAVEIPVIASGDALSPFLVKRLFDETGCHGIALARGALGNPWLLRDIEAFYSTGRCPERPPLREIISTMRDHLDLLCSHYGERDGTIRFRKFFSWYARGFRHIRQLRQHVFTVTTRAGMFGILHEIEEAKPAVLQLYDAYPS